MKKDKNGTYKNNSGLKTFWEGIVIFGLIFPF